MTGIRTGWIPRFASPEVASTRIRCLNILGELQRRGLQAELFSPKRFETYGILIFLKAYERDHIVLAQQAKTAGKFIVLDLCDNHFVKANSSPSECNRIRNLDEMLNLADSIVTSTEALAGLIAKRHSSLASRISVIGDAVEDAMPSSRLLGGIVERMMLFLLRRFIDIQQKSGRTPLVWFGIHGGDNAEYGMRDVFKIADQLNALSATHDISLTIISNSYGKYRALCKAFTLPMFYMPWGPSTFLHALTMHKISIIPVTRNAFTDCKSNNRVALSIARGLAVVTSTPIPAYEEFLPYIKHGHIGNGVRAYIEDPMRAVADIQAGKRYVQHHYSLESVASQWEALLSIHMKSYFRLQEKS